jgi:hypothetical protein
MHDEMKIRSDLVYDAKTGEMVGFVNRAQQDGDLATHVLCFYIVGLSSNLSMSIGFFPTRNACASDVYARLWIAIGLLEKVCCLKVICDCSVKELYCKWIFHLIILRSLFALPTRPHLICQ